jgi:hypothetical protein
LVIVPCRLISASSKPVNPKKKPVEPKKGHFKWSIKFVCWSATTPFFVAFHKTMKIGTEMLRLKLQCTYVHIFKAVWPDEFVKKSPKE